MDENKCLLAAGNLLQAHTWKGLLQVAGIAVELRGEALQGGLGELALPQVELWVKESDLPRAQAHLESAYLEQPQWQCLQCHEMNEGSFELCWQCSAERSERHN